MALLQQQIHIIGKRRKSGEATAKSRHQQHIHRRGDEIVSLGKPQKRTDDETSYNIYYKCAQRKSSQLPQVAQSPRQVTQAGAHKAAQTRNQHSLYHNSSF